VTSPGKDALAVPAVRSRRADLGQEIFPQQQQSPEVLPRRDIPDLADVSSEARSATFLTKASFGGKLHD